ncbi:hypothetical protein CPC08DRAFT_766139 [Agrocybe pediades]|nr:hypothetical protein CPC08DRAFT_766139 [Agrocybe pediades]
MKASPRFLSSPKMVDLNNFPSTPQDHQENRRETLSMLSNAISHPNSTPTAVAAYVDRLSKYLVADNKVSDEEESYSGEESNEEDEERIDYADDTLGPEEGMVADDLDDLGLAEL